MRYFVHLIIFKYLTISNGEIYCTDCTSKEASTSKHLWFSFEVFIFTSESFGCNFLFNQSSYFIIWLVTKTDSAEPDLSRKKVASVSSSN